MLFPLNKLLYAKEANGLTLLITNEDNIFWLHSARIKVSNNRLLRLLILNLQKVLLFSIATYRHKNISVK